MAQVRLEVEQVYVDDRVPTTRTLRVLGRIPDGPDHGAVAIPLGPEMSGQWTDTDGRVDLVQGGDILSIIPSPGRRQRAHERGEAARGYRRPTSAAAPPSILGAQPKAPAHTVARA